MRRFANVAFVLALVVTVATAAGLAASLPAGATPADITPTAFSYLPAVERPPATPTPTATPEPTEDLSSPSCGKLLLRTSKNYAQVLPEQPAAVRFYAFVLECDADGRANGASGVDGPLEFEYRVKVDGLDGPGYKSLATLLDEYDDVHDTFQRSFTNGIWEFTVLPKDLAADPAAYLYRARLPAGDGAWSEWIHVNYNTTDGLLRAVDYWPDDPGAPERAYEGYNAVYDRAFNSRIGYKPVDYFNPPGKPLPPLTGNSNAVMYFLKDNVYGYHNPQTPFSNAPNDGYSNGLFWIDVAPYGGNPGERWLLSNAFEYYEPLSAEGDVDPWPDWTNYDYLQERTAVHELLMGSHETSPPDLREYILAPEYAGRGWGIVVDSEAIGGITWSVHANLWTVEQLPGLEESGSTEPVLQLKFFEGPTGFLEAGSTAHWGHREDWFLTRDGVLRIEDRGTGYPHLSVGAGNEKARYPAANDPDVLHREIIKYPHLCMTARELVDGECPAGRSTVP